MERSNINHRAHNYYASMDENGARYDSHEAAGRDAFQYHPRNKDDGYPGYSMSTRSRESLDSRKPSYRTNHGEPSYFSQYGYSPQGMDDGPPSLMSSESSSFDTSAGELDYSGARKMPASQLGDTSKKKYLYSYAPYPSPQRGSYRTKSNKWDHEYASAPDPYFHANKRTNGSGPQLVEISPGVHLPLRGAKETWEAVMSDFFVPCACIACSSTIFSIADAEYVLCPLCTVVSKIDESHYDGHGGSVGLGFSMENLAKWQKELRGNSEVVEHWH